MNLGEKIRSLREEKRLTQVALAERTGLAQATICRLERAGGEDRAGRHRVVSGETLRSLARVLEVPVDFLIGETQSRPPEAGVTMDKAAQRIVETFSAAGPSGKELLVNLAACLRSQQAQLASLHTTAPQPDDPRKVDAVLKQEEILYRVDSVERHPEQRDGLFPAVNIEYSCTVSAVRLRAGTGVEFKTIEGEAVAFINPRPEDIAESVQGEGSYSMPDCFNLNEPIILARAIEKAKEAAARKLQK